MTYETGKVYQVSENVTALIRDNGEVVFTEHFPEKNASKEIASFSLMVLFSSSQALQKAKDEGLEKPTVEENLREALLRHLLLRDKEYHILRNYISTCFGKDLNVIDKMVKTKLDGDKE